MTLPSSIDDSVRELATRAEPSRVWNEAESVLAFLLLVYLDPARLGGTKTRADGSRSQHPAVQRLAQIIGRSADAVSWKIQNQRFVLTAGARGARGGSSRDVEVVGRYALHLDALWEVVGGMALLLPQLPELLKRLGCRGEDESAAVVSATPSAPITIPEGGTSVRRDGAVRRGQGAFRDRVLANYGDQCAVCDLWPATPRASGLFLRAGHIRPWAEASDHQRLDPRNGLSLCVMHDRAFEGGLFTLDDDLAVVTASRARELFTDKGAFERAVGGLRERIDARTRDFERPGAEYLAFHRKTIFERVAWATLSV